MAQSKRMVNNQTSQYEFLNKKKSFVPFRHFSIRQRHITKLTSYRLPCSLVPVGFLTAQFLQKT